MSVVAHGGSRRYLRRRWCRRGVGSLADRGDELGAENTEFEHGMGNAGAGTGSRPRPMTNPACRLPTDHANRLFDHRTRCAVVLQLQVPERQTDQLARALLLRHRAGRCTGEHLREGWVHTWRFLHKERLALRATFHKVASRIAPSARTRAAVPRTTLDSTVSSRSVGGLVPTCGRAVVVLALMRVRRSDHSSFRVRIPCSQLLVDVRHPPMVVARP